MEQSSYISTITKGHSGVVGSGGRCYDIGNEKQQGCSTSGTARKM